MVHALRAKKELIERAQSALQRKDFPENIAFFLRIHLRIADKISPQWFVERVKGYLHEANKLVLERNNMQTKARAEYKAALKRRDELKRKLSMMELVQDDAEDVAIMIAMFNRHLNSQRGKAIPKCEEDLVMTPGEFIEFTERYLIRPKPIAPAVPREQPAAAPMAKTAS